MFAAIQGFFSQVSAAIGKLLMIKASPSNTCYDSVTDTSGNIIAIYYGGTGTTNLLAKFNSDGTLLWQRLISNTTGGTFVAKNVLLDSSNNIYVFCTVGSAKTEVLKYNPSGTLVWQKEIASFSANMAFTNNSKTKFYLAGPTLVILDTSGNITFQTGITASGGGFTVTNIQAIYVDSSDNYYIIGTKSYTITTNTVTMGTVIKYNSSNVLQWSQGIGPTLSSNTWTGNVVAATTDNAGDVYLLLFRKNSSTNANLPPGLIKLSGSTGIIYWSYTFTGTVPANNSGSSLAMQTDSDNNLTIIIQLDSTTYQNLICKLSGTTPSFIWRNYYKGNGTSTIVNLLSLALSDVEISSAGNFTPNSGTTFYGYYVEFPKDGSGTGIISNAIGNFIYADASSFATINALTTNAFSVTATTSSSTKTIGSGTSTDSPGTNTFTTATV